MECYPRRGVFPIEALSQGKDAVSRACPGLQGTKEALEDMRNFYKRTSRGHIRIRLRGASLYQKKQKNGEKVELIHFVIHSIPMALTNTCDFSERKSSYCIGEYTETKKSCLKIVINR